MASNYTPSFETSLFSSFSEAFASVTDKQNVDTFSTGCLFDELFQRKSTPHPSTVMVTFIHQLHFPPMGKKKLNFDWCVRQWWISSDLKNVACPSVYLKCAVTTIFINIIAEKYGNVQLQHFLDK